jgi:hypothetical protein
LVRSAIPFLPIPLNWLARKANWNAPLSQYTSLDVVTWVIKLAPLFAFFLPLRRDVAVRAVVLCVTAMSWRFWYLVDPNRSSGRRTKLVFWFFGSVVSLQIYLLAVESVTSVVLPARFTAAFIALLLVLLGFVMVICHFMVSAARSVWVGPPTAVTPLRKRSFHKSALTSSVWVDDYVKTIDRRVPLRKR